MAENPIALRSKKRLTGALDTLMRQKPYREITITELCGEAGLSRPAFYQNFGRISDVLERLISEKMAEAIANVDFGTPGSARDLALACLDILDYSPDFIAVLVRNELTRPIAVELAERLSGDERFISSLGEFPNEQSSRFTAAFVAAGISIALAIWLEESDVMTRDEALEMIVFALKGGSLS